MVLTLSVREERFAVCRLDPQAAVPHWVTGGPFLSITRTMDELSVICSEQCVPPDVHCERSWRLFKFEGPFDFAAAGVLVSVAQPLAEAGVSILAVATYDTDYLLVREEQYAIAKAVLTAHGHGILG